MRNFGVRAHVFVQANVFVGARMRTHGFVSRKSILLCGCVGVNANTRRKRSSRVHVGLEMPTDVGERVQTGAFFLAYATSSTEDDPSGSQLFASGAHRQLHRCLALV